MTIVRIGLDLAKTTFSLCGVSYLLKGNTYTIFLKQVGNLSDYYK